MRWGKKNDSTDDKKFEDILGIPGVTALMVVAKDNILERIKQDNTAFTEQIIKEERRHILYDLIDIALRPQEFNARVGTQLGRQQTHTAIELLSTFSEEFTEAIFGVDETPKNSEDEVIQEQACEKVSANYPILTHIMHILEEQKVVEQTPLSYFARLMTPFLYQRPREILEQLVCRVDVLNQLLRHFYSRSVCDLVSKLLQIDNDNKFYEHTKMKVFHGLARLIKNTEMINGTGIKGHIEEQMVEELLENMNSLLEVLLEKHEDKFDRSKYSHLVREVLTERTFFQQICKKMCSAEGDIRAKALPIISTYLKFSGCHKVQVKQDNSDSCMSETKLNQEIISDFEESLIATTPKQLQASKKIQLIQYYKVIHSISVLDPSFLSKVFTLPFAQSTFKLMLNTPKNDILHNLQRDVVIEALKHQQALTILLHYQSGFLVAVQNNLYAGNGKQCFEPHLFRILMALHNKMKLAGIDNQTVTKLQGTIAQKKGFYDKLICNDPRKNDQERWNIIQQQVVLTQFDGMGETVVSEEQDKCETLVISQQIQMEIESEEDGGDVEGNHFFDSGLPLDSDEDMGGYLASQILPKPSVEKQLAYDSMYFECYLHFNLSKLLKEVE